MIGPEFSSYLGEISRQVHYPGMLLLAWAVTAVITILGALSYGELAAAMPKAGGQYIYLKEAFGPLYGFLYGWTLFSVIQTGTIAAVGVAFAKFTGVFFPEIGPERLVFAMGNFAINTQQLLAVGVIVLLTLYNFREVKSGAFLQNIFTVSKVAALILLVVLGFYFGMKGLGDWSNFSPAFPDVMTLATIGVFGAAMTGSFFRRTHGTTSPTRREKWIVRSVTCRSRYFLAPASCWCSTSWQTWPTSTFCPWRRSRLRTTTG